jgi:hypothetical protein
MANVVVKMKQKGCTELRNSKGVQSFCVGITDAMASRANSQGNGTYVSDVQAGKTRCHAMCKTTDRASVVDNATNNRLLKCMGV